jgi:hypothetical protein
MNITEYCPFKKQAVLERLSAAGITHEFAFDEAFVQSLLDCEIRFHISEVYRGGVQSCHLNKHSIYPLVLPNGSTAFATLAWPHDPQSDF